MYRDAQVPRRPWTAESGPPPPPIEKATHMGGLFICEDSRNLTNSHALITDTCSDMTARLENRLGPHQAFQRNIKPLVQAAYHF